MTDEMNQGGALAPAPAPAPAPTPASAPEPTPVFDLKDVADNKVVAALSYLWILFLVPMLMKKESAFCQFHAKQGLVMCIVWVVGSFIFWIPIIGWFLMLAFFVLNIIALVKTLSGQAWQVPVVYDFSKKLNL